LFWCWLFALIGLISGLGLANNFNPLDLDGDDAKDTIQSRIKMLESANETENGWRNIVDGRVAHWCTQRGVLAGLSYGTSV
jgi:hypothetical protein